MSEISYPQVIKKRKVYNKYKSKLRSNLEKSKNEKSE